MTALPADPTPPDDPDPRSGPDSAAGSGAGPEPGDCFHPTVSERIVIDRILLVVRRRWSPDRYRFDRNPVATVERLVDELSSPTIEQRGVPKVRAVGSAGPAVQVIGGPPSSGPPDRRRQMVDHVLSRAWDARQSELWEVVNRSRWKIILPEMWDSDGQPDDLVLAPLERRITNVHPRHLYPVRVLVRHQLLGVRPYRPPRTSGWKLAAGLATIVLLIQAVAALAWGGRFRSQSFAIGMLAAAVFFAVVALVWGWKSVNNDHHAADTGPGDPATYRDSFAAPPSSSDAGLWLVERASYLLMLAITVVGPALALYYGTDLTSYLRFSPSGVKVLVAGNVTRADALHQVVGRALQLVYCSVVSMLPALLYDMFDRERLSSQRESWVRHLFHLNPHIWTVSEIEAAYGSRLDEALGGGGMSGRLVGGRRQPIVVATILLTLGWTLLLLDTQVEGPNREAGVYLDLLLPKPTLAGMAFLGTYFFTLQFILRSFIRGDLRPKSYSTIAVRVVAGVTVAYLVSKVIPSSSDHSGVLLAAFLAGYVPDTVLRRVANLGKGIPGFRWLKEVTDDIDGNERDLNLISGMDIYAKTKLISEGITNVETLAHTDPIDLMARTRFPAAELIEWIDQALLLLHVGSDLTKAMAEHGVRTATNLCSLCDHCGSSAIAALFGDEAVLDTVLANLRQEPVLTNLEAWRRSTTVGLGQELPTVLHPQAHPAEQGWDQPWVDRDSIRCRHHRFDLRQRSLAEDGGFAPRT